MSSLESNTDGTDHRAEAVETCGNLASDDEQISTDEQQFSAASDKLLEVEQLVDDLQALAHELEVASKTTSKSSEFPRHLRQRVRRLLSEEGLDELHYGKREEARLRILGALGLCLKSVESARFMEGDLVGDKQLSVSEVEALYRPLESSTALRELDIDGRDFKGRMHFTQVELESWQLLADILHGAKALERLFWWDVPASGLSHFAKAVAAGGGQSLPITYLDVVVKVPTHHGWTAAGFNDGSAGSVAALIRAAPKLEVLVLRSGGLGYFVDEDGARLIGQAIVQLQSLEALRISVGEESRDHSFSPEPRPMGWSFAGHLLSRVFLGLQRSSSISSLSVWYPCNTKPGSMIDLPVLSQVLKTCTTLKKVHFFGKDQFLSRDMVGFFKSLQGNVYLQSLTLEVGRLAKSGAEIENVGFDGESFDMLVEGLKSTSMPALKNFTFNFCLQPQDDEVRALDWRGFYTAFGQNTTIESLAVRGYLGYQEAEEEILQWITSTKTLHSLTVDPRKGEVVNWRSIFKCMGDNTSLERLAIPGQSIDDDDAYRELMVTLQVNSTLQEAEFSTAEGRRERVATIRGALRSKVRQESYLRDLRKGFGQSQVTWQSPKCGRIFLCGSPQAGKTRLTKTMLKVVKRKSWMNRLKEKILGRTKGIEIHTLRNDDNMQILVWDLGGQDIFRALQKFLFPRLNTAYVFLFVFSPYDHKSKEKKKQLEVAFENEFLHWLKFIASNSTVSGFNLPQVIVVISHKDKYKSHEVHLPSSWSKRVLERLINEYEDVIQIHPHIYFIDGHECEHVNPIVENMYHIFDDLFKQKLFKVPLACSHLSQELVRWALENPKEPIISETHFFSLCGNIPDLRNASQNIHNDDNRRLLKAVGSYLHDVGTVIDMSKDLMVVSPHWLTHVFLGRFISFGHEFELGDEEASKWTTHDDGFLGESDFQQLLCDRMLQPMQEQFPKLTMSILQQLMERLDLLYVIATIDQKNDTNSRYFIPTLFKAKSASTLQWSENAFPEKTKDSDLVFLGVRVRCKDAKRTYLSSAFFNGFQVTIWRKFKEHHQLENPFIQCKFNLIILFVNGFDILIENDEDGDFIDVMVRSIKSKRMVWNYVKKHIVEELQDFCASPKGSPGVELVMDILRTECVKHLTLCKYRRNQCVSREDLKSNLMNSIHKLGTMLEEKDLWLHTWMVIPEVDMKASCEETCELLPPEDIDEAYAWIKDSTESLQAKVFRVGDVIRELNNDNQRLDLGDVESNNFGKFKRSRSAQWIDSNDTHYIIQGMQDLNVGVRKIGEYMKELLIEVRDLKQEIHVMKCLQQKELDSLSQIYRELDKLIGNSMSKTMWPKYPYFTRKDVSISHRIIAIVDIGKPLMLHFQCEEKSGHHFVPGQPGYGITVGKENCEALRQIAQNSVQIICYLLKAGLHITSGLGGLVPQVQTSDGEVSRLTSTSIVQLLKKVRVQDDNSSKQVSFSPEEAWKYLQDFLRRELENRITELFLLHPAHYFDGRSTRVWLCQNCLDNGQKNDCLEKL